jgi:cyclopropane fatty-acyl-phospholipid synthase-like methyltransferase
VNKFYELSFEQFGFDPRALGWADKQCQQKRFQKIIDAGITSGDSVLDVGSGFSDFFIFAKERIGHIDYTGIEKLRNFAKIAKDNVVKENGTIINGDIWETKINKNFDWVVASGLFPFDYEGYSEDLYYTVKKMFIMSKKGTCFNLLSSQTPDQEKFPMMKYNDPSHVTKVVSNISNKFNLFHGYMNNDMTIHIYR